MRRYLIILLALAAVLNMPGEEVVKLLKLSELGLPAAVTDGRLKIRLINVAGGEALLDTEAKEVNVLIRLRAPGAVRGVVVTDPVLQLTTHDLHGAPLPGPPPEPTHVFPFTIAATAFTAAPDGSERMRRAEANHFRGLLGEDGPRSVMPNSPDRGARAWWSLRLGNSAGAPAAAAGQQRGHDELDQTIDLFSGLTALDENLQFDRALTISGGGLATVETASLPELTTREVPWKLMPGAQEGGEQQIDALAKLIPADQHAVFFPSFSAMSAAVQHADQTLSGPLQLLAGHGEDALTRERYQRQLGVELSELSQRFGALVIDRIALTGSDPFLRLGSDVAVLLHATQPALLAAYLAARQQAQVAAGGLPSDGALGALTYHAVETPDHALSSFVLFDGDCAVIANSLVQLNAYAEVRAGHRPALAAAGEFAYFRRRYVQDGAELALVVISDATIRRWCSARWRIGDSRRTRAHARLCALQAQWIAAGCPPQWAPQGASDPSGELGTLTFTADGVRSSRYGSLTFMTPIGELDLRTVTMDEAAAYRRFIERYQRSWRDYLDPIAIRLQALPAGRLAVDLSILPLIVSSEYGQIFRLTGIAALAPGAADPHPAPFQIAIALDHQGGLLADADRDLAPILGGLTSPLGWVGDAASLYVDADPFWEEMASTFDRSWIEENLARLPLAITIAVRNPLKLAAFLSGVKVLVEQSAPGLVSWSTRSWKDISYAVVSPSAENRNMFKNAELLYLAAPEGLTITLSESVMHHAIERLAARRAAAAAGAPLPPQPWPGEQLAAGLELPFLGQLTTLNGEFGLDFWMRQRINDDIAILNEWHRLFPGEDPLTVHQRLWGTRLICPLGGTYRWNEAWLSMESTALGAPDHNHMPESRLPAAFAAIAALRAGVGFTRLPDPPLAGQQPAAELPPAPGTRAWRTSLGLHTRLEIEAAPAAR
jgi:hypothetical protein